MAESQAAQIVRLQEKLSKIEKDCEERDARLTELEKHDDQYEKIISNARFAGLVILGAGALLAWIFGRLDDIRNFLSGR